MEPYEFVAERVKEVRERIGEACARSGRSPQHVNLMAVTKFHPLTAVEAAWRAGLRLFGENRVQEAAEKFPAFLAERPEARLHLIGTLQSNKAKKAVELFDCVQSVHTLDLARELGKRALAAGRRLDILLELHTAEDSKSGFPGRAALLAACDELARVEALRVRGLMTMAPWTSAEAPIRASFRALRSAFEELAASGRFEAFDTLSMGMSNDYEIAVEEGATLLRIGTAIFGARDAPKPP